MNGSMETVLECVIPYIHDRDDRNSISLVSRKFYELDFLTRKHLTVHLFYAPTLSRLSERFLFIESLTLKGCPNDFKLPFIWSIDIASWIEEIAFKFKHLKALQIRGLYVRDEDLELLVRTRCRDLRSLKIYQCQGVSADGLMHVSKYCNDLRTLCLEGTFIIGPDENDGGWLHELALHNKVIESLHFDCDSIDVKDLTLIAKQCSNSLVSLKINPFYLSDLEDAFGHAIKLEKFHRSIFDEYADYSSFTFPQNIRGLCIEVLPETAFPFLLPYVNQLRELHLPCIDLERNCQCFLIERCPNLEVLLTYDANHMGLIALAQGCPNLENLDVTLLDISNEAMEYVGTYLKNLRKFCMNLVNKSCIIDLPLDNGIRAMLIGCKKLKRLHVSLCHGGLTDVGLGYIGKYGHNLRNLSQEYTGESDAGLVELSKGCPKLRKLRIMECPFSEQAVEIFLFNIHTLRYIKFFFGDCGLALTRPTVPADAEGGGMGSLVGLLNGSK
ncbi:hypothetical protein Tco_1475300 [Tanacetum coccineum]